jgi:Gpi18-like mannosyltransferase
MTSLPPSRTFWDDLVLGLSYYYLTSLIVVLGVVFGYDFVQPVGKQPTEEPDFLRGFVNWDAKYYKAIVEQGYSYDPDQPSIVAFFPAYPLLAGGIVYLTGCRTELALLLVAHGFLAAGFVLLVAYVRQRYGDAPELSTYVLLAFGLFPTTFFLRMAYTESMFVCLTILALLAMERRWPRISIALVVGLATATRPVGIALVPVFALHLWRRSPSRRAFVLQALVLLPLACWGLLAYMAYLFAAFDEPLAFASSQMNWRMDAREHPLSKTVSLLTLEPIWGLYVPSWPRFWQRYETHRNPLFSLIFANPIIFIAAIALIVMGACKRWLSRDEVLLAAGLLLIPYITRSYEMSMASMGRFAAAAVPLYLALGNLLWRTPLPLMGWLLALSSFFLSAYAILFSVGYRLF